MLNKKFHIPLWKSFRNEEIKRLYFRIEVLAFTNWASGGRNSDGSSRVYRQGVEFTVNFTICHGKVEYPITCDDY